MRIEWRRQQAVASDVRCTCGTYLVFVQLKNRAGEKGVVSVCQNCDGDVPVTRDLKPPK